MARSMWEEKTFVYINLYRMPGSLVREFALKFAYKYLYGIGEAIQGLMRNAIKG
jgi:hypothetical protein